MRTTAGAPDLAAYVPASDADAVARLRREGAIIFGKTNLPVYAMDWQSTNRSSGPRTTPGTWTAPPAAPPAERPQPSPPG
jgi:amidase